MNDDDAAYKLESALALVETLFPNAIQPLAAMDVRLDSRVKTAAVTDSGRMLVSPTFLATLTLRQTVFIIAHELYHVLYGVFDRFDSNTTTYRRWLVNIAHDFIINDMLEKKFRDEYFIACSATTFVENARPSYSEYIPSQGLFWKDYAESYRRIVGKEQPPLESFSLESLVLELELIRDELPSGNPLNQMISIETPDRSWNTELGGLLDQAMKGMDGGAAEQEVEESAAPAADRGAKQRDFSNILNGEPELLTEREEAKLFPDETAVERARRRTRIFEAAELASARNILSNELATRGGMPGNGDYIVQALEGNWNPPWERVLQKWFDDTVQSTRSWAKASRRAGNRTDIVLPGRMREGHIIHVVADTSGSMGALLPAVFGLLKSFGKASGVNLAHIVQCDTDVVSDEIVDIDGLDTVEVKGLGGGMNPPGMLHMAEDETIESVLVITDGYINIPRKKDIPYDVLWCLLCYNGDTSHFNPDYGTVMSIPSEELLPST